MNTAYRSGKSALLGLLVFFTISAAIILVFAGAAVAGPQADEVVYLPHVTSPPDPIDTYETDFADSIEPWEAVRWKVDTDYGVTHNSGCDGGHCGFLDVDVNTTQTYVNVSPLIVGPEPPYRIVFRAKQKDLKDQVQYGIVFGADWQRGACPGDNIDNCFNRYYEFRVLYRDSKGDKYVQYRIRRIDGMDDDQNESYYKTLVDWSRAQDVDAEDWIEWEVHYGADGKMTIKANGQEQAGSAHDKNFADFLYFGVGVRGGPNGDTEARFDKFSIAAD